MRVPIAVPVAFLGCFFITSPPVPAQAQDGDFALELRAGMTLASSTLGVTSAVPVGEFGLQQIESAPVLALGAIGPRLAIGARPHVRVSYALPARVQGTWSICDTSQEACPAILHPPLQADASRLELTAGLELPGPALRGVVHPYLNAGVGVRRYGFSYDPVAAGGAGSLESGTISETDFLVRFGAGAAFPLGAFEASLEGGLDFSSFGSGTVPLDVESLAQRMALLDDGRDRVREFSVTAGVRRYLN